MGKRKKAYENEARFARCEVCYDDIPIEFYFDKGELVICSQCGTEYILECRHPVILSLAVSDYDDGYFEGLEYDDY